jgi:hypothetical protein
MLDTASVADDNVPLRPTARMWVVRGLWFVIGAAMVLLFSRYRTIPHVFALSSIVAWRISKTLRTVWFATAVLIGFLALEFYLPFDISMVSRPGGPAIRQLKMGLFKSPRPEADDSEHGGCMSFGNEPRWILVW